MKKETILFITLAFFLVIISSVSAASVTLVSPASNAVISGTATLNATITGVAGNFTCKFYAKSSSTANNTWTLLKTQANTTATDAATTFSSTSLEDSNDYVFNATCYNDTDSWGDDTNTGITIDNTVPQTPTSLSPADGTIDDDGSVTFTATVVDENTTYCTLYFVGGNPGQSSYTMTQTPGTTTCTKTLTNIPEQTYTWYVIASDGSNSSSASSSNTISVDVKKSAGKAVLLAELEKEGKVKRIGGKTFAIVEEGLNTTVLGMPLWLLLGLVILAIIIYRLNKK